MENQFCNYEISLALKELGFDEKCLAYHTSPNQNEIYLDKDGEKTRFCLLSEKISGELTGHGSVRNSLFQWLLDNDKTYGELYTLAHSVTVPLYQQAIDWFRIKHNIHLDIYSIGYADSSIPDYTCDIWDNRDGKGIYVPSIIFSEYEECRLYAIRRGITILKGN